MKYKAWIHTREGNLYRPSAGRRLKVHVQDPRGDTVYQTLATVGAFGSLDGQFKLDSTAPLGSYDLQLDTEGFGNGGSFRVEEYKKPEFEVTVKPRSNLARLGDTVEGTIEARYAFGGAVSNGRVNYRIFRNEYVHQHAPSAPWDWLYGPGHGGCWYDYSWLPGWREFGPRPWLPFGQFHGRAQRELVAEGSESLRDDGTVPFRVDTSSARRDHPDRDHLYTIEAEVVDASRRLVRGSGEVKVTRREFFVFVDVDRGYYQPGDPILVQVKATTADGKPARAELALTAFDQAVLAFGHDNAPDLRSHYWGSRRSHTFWMASSLQTTFNPDGAVNAPEEQVESELEQAWLGIWGLFLPGFLRTSLGDVGQMTEAGDDSAGGTMADTAMGMTPRADAGDGTASIVTTKGLLVRLQAPRFFVERDRVVLSANVHSRLATDKKARVTLTVPSELMELLSPATVEVPVPAGKEARVDWEVAVRREGFAAVKMEALTDEESDAMQMGFPVRVHGLEKTVTKTGMLRPDGPGVAELRLEVPAERRPEASRLEVRFSPSLAGAIMDAVPYLLDYPYGCTEQTMSRFAPAVLVQKSLLGMGLSLDDLARERANSAEAVLEIGNPK